MIADGIFISEAELVRRQMSADEVLDNISKLYRHIGDCRSCMWGLPESCPDYRRLEALAWPNKNA